MTAREITAEAVEKGLVSPRGKTPHETMRAELYVHIGKDPELVKIEERGNKRANRGSVRWTLLRV
jgi:hypothetical protein